MAPQRARFLVAAILALALITLSTSWGRRRVSGWHSNSPQTVEEDVPADYTIDAQVANSTLGFEKILAINLPERTDRKAMLDLMTKSQGVEVEWLDAVNGRDIPISKLHEVTGIPADRHVQSASETANFKSHRKAWQQVLDSGYNTALVIEDDADWDVSLKSQLKEFATALREIENRKRPADDQLDPHNRTMSPYGSQWDLLWIGICANPPGDDADAVLFPGVDDTEAHWVYEVNGGTSCAYAYAVNQRSARLMLSRLENESQPSDLGMSSWCGHSDVNCMLVWPMLISSHKARGSMSKDSNIQHAAETDGNATAGDNFREKGESWKIVHSAMLDALEKAESSQGLV